MKKGWIIPSPFIIICVTTLENSDWSKRDFSTSTKRTSAEVSARHHTEKKTYVPIWPFGRSIFTLVNLNTTNSHPFNRSRVFISYTSKRIDGSIFGRASRQISCDLSYRISNIYMLCDTSTSHLRQNLILCFGFPSFTALIHPNWDSAMKLRTSGDDKIFW